MSDLHLPLTRMAKTKGGREGGREGGLFSYLM